MAVWTDEEIWQGLQDPNQRQRAASALSNQYAGKLLTYLRNRCDGDNDLADELLVAVLHKAVKALSKRTMPCDSLLPWLYTIAAHTAIDEFRKRTTLSEHMELVPLDEGLVSTPPSREFPAPEVNDQRVAALQAVLSELEAEDPRYRTLIEMEWVGGCGREELAEATAIPRKQLSQYLIRAKERFLKLARKYPALAELDQKFK